MLSLLGAFALLSMSPVADDAQIVIGMLEQRCISCHGPQKSKGKLRLDGVEGLSSVLKPGDAAESDIYFVVSLPHDDPDVMPAKGEPCTPAEIQALKRWIEAGAPMKAIKAHMAERATASSLRALELDELRQATGALVSELLATEDHSQPVRVDYARRDEEPSAKEVAALEPEAQNIIELSFAGQSVGAAELRDLPQLPALERLHLERTQMNDRALGALVKKTPALRYLNLHSTQVTRAGMRTLKSLAALEHLVLFDTSIDAQQLESVRKALPKVRVSGELTLPSMPFPDTSPRRLLLADASKNRIAIMREINVGNYDMLWEHKTQQIHDLQVLANGNILFQENWTKLIEVNPTTGETVWSYDAKERNRKQSDERLEVHAFQRLADGVTMIAESGPARIIEVDAQGKLLRTVRLTVDKPNAHSDTRLVRKTPAGTYLVAHENDGVVREYNAKGKVIWSYDVPLFDREPKGGHGPDAWGDKLFCALRLASGNTLITTGNGHGLIEVNPEGQIVWQIMQDDLEGVRLAWVTTVQELSNGNLVIGNCHAGPDQPQLVEITRDKQVVWTFKDMQRFGNSLCCAWVIEDPYRNWQHRTGKRD